MVPSRPPPHLLRQEGLPDFQLSPSASQALEPLESFLLDGKGGRQEEGLPHGDPMAKARAGTGPGEEERKEGQSPAWSVRPLPRSSPPVLAWDRHVHSRPCSVGSSQTRTV